jgi:hypothetical protein
MQIKKVEVIVPKGIYVIGDPCSAVPNDDWDDLLASCNYFQSPIGYVRRGFTDKVFVLAFGTKWGDGCYAGSDGHEYPVDAGLLGLVPVEIVEELVDHDGDYDGVIVKFDRDTLCIDDGSGKLKFGHITIDTDPEDPEEEEDE